MRFSIKPKTQVILRLCYDNEIHQIQAHLIFLVETLEYDCRKRDFSSEKDEGNIAEKYGEKQTSERNGGDSIVHLNVVKNRWLDIFLPVDGYRDAGQVRVSTHREQKRHTHGDHDSGPCRLAHARIDWEEGDNEALRRDSDVDTVHDALAYMRQHGGSYHCVVSQSQRPRCQNQSGKSVVVHTFTMI